MNDFPTSLLEEKGHMVTVLSQKLTGLMREVRADLSPYGATLLCFTEEGKTRKFCLTDQEADAFAMSWLAFRGAAYDAEQAEIRRLDEVKAEAYAIAEACSAIIIQEIEANRWNVDLTEIGFPYAGEVTGPDKLLWAVEQAKAICDKNQRHLKEVERALVIAERVGVTIECPNQSYYHLRFNGLEQTWVTPDFLLGAVKSIADEYLNKLLTEHEDINVVKVAEGTAEHKAVWTVSRDGDVRTAQGFAEVLRAVEALIAEREAVTN